MTRNAKRLAGTGIILILTVLGFATISHFRNPTDLPQSIRLPDGTELTLVAASFGTNHVAPATLSQQIADHMPKSLVRRLPLWLSRKVGPSSRSTMSSPVPSLGIWFDLAANPSPANGVGIYITFADESGRESLTGNQRQFNPGNNGLTIDAFPRRSSTVRMRAYVRGRSLPDNGGPPFAPPVRVGEFRFANPFHDGFSEWKAVATTARNPAGDFEATIRKIAVGRDIDIEPRLSTGDWFSGIANIEIRHHGRVSTNWSTHGFQLSDATGNHVDTYPWSKTACAGGECFRFTPTLLPDLSPWKVRAEFVRLPTAKFAVDEQVTFMNVPIPPAGEAAYGNWIANVQGVTLTMAGLAGTDGSLTNSPFNSSDFAPHEEPQIVAEIAPNPEGYNLAVIRIVSNLGNEIKACDVAGSWSSDSKSVKFIAPLPTNASTVDITFAVHKSQFLEFTVKPEIVTTNPSKESSKGSTR